LLISQFVHASWTSNQIKINLVNHFILFSIWYLSVVPFFLDVYIILQGDVVTVGPLGHVRQQSGQQRVEGSVRA
jgi:hypothetical protein